MERNARTSTNAPLRVYAIISVIIHPAPMNVPVHRAIASRKIAVMPLMVSSVCARKKLLLFLLAFCCDARIQIVLGENVGGGGVL